jgi:hypothetical protein
MYKYNLLIMGALSILEWQRRTICAGGLPTGGMEFAGIPR